MGPNLDDIDDAFAYHPPKDENVAKSHGAIRAACHQAAEVIFELVPESPERTTAINKVREAMFWANAAIAVHS